MINYHYWLATASITIGIFISAIPVLFPEENINKALSIGAIIATFANMTGVSHFFLIPIYTWFSHRIFTAAHYVLYLFITCITGLLIITPPQSSFANGIIHWRFNHLISFIILLFISVAFSLNVLLLGNNFKKLRAFSYLNSIALIVTFSLTGVSSAYLYVGDNSMLLGTATVFLYIGIGIIFFTSVRTAITLYRNERRRGDI